jgi:hypothetical protein
MARQLTTHLSCWCMFGDQNSSHSAGDARADFLSSPRQSHDLRSLRRNSRQLRESVLPEIDENRMSHAMVNLRCGTLHRQSGIASRVEALKASRDSRYAVHSIRAQYTRPGSLATLALDQSVRNLRRRGTGSRFDGHCGCVHGESRSNHRKRVTQAQQEYYDFAGTTPTCRILA